MGRQPGMESVLLDVINLLLTLILPIQTELSSEKSCLNTMNILDLSKSKITDTPVAI